MSLDPGIIERLPKMPHWRWVLWHVIEHGGHQDSDAQCRELARWAKVKWLEFDEMLCELEIDYLDAHFNQKKDPDVDAACALYSDRVHRLGVERCLSANMPSREIAELIATRFGVRHRPQVYEVYEMTFFDLEHVTLLGAMRWMESMGLPWRDLYCPLPNSMRTAWVKHKLGETPSLGGSDVVNHLLIQTLLASEEAMKTNPCHKTKLAWSNQVLKVLETMKSLGYIKQGGGDLPEHLWVTEAANHDDPLPSPEDILRRGE
jgi:hypothetical protein